VRKHLGQALAELESAGRIKIAGLKRDGKKRRLGTFPNDALVSFL
jgi:hypothetical protein